VTLVRALTRAFSARLGVIRQVDNPSLLHFVAALCCCRRATEDGNVGPCAGSGSSCLEVGEPYGQPLPIGCGNPLPRDRESLSLESLDPVLEHGTVDLVQDVAADADLEVRADADDVLVEARVVDLAEGEPIGDDRLAQGVLAGRYTFVEEGISDPSGDGPTVA